MGLAMVLHTCIGISPLMSEDRDSFLFVKSPRWQACFSPSPGLDHSLWALSWAWVVVEWPEGRLICAQVQLLSQLELVEMAEVRKL